MENPALVMHKPAQHARHDAVDTQNLGTQGRLWTVRPLPDGSTCSAWIMKSMASAVLYVGAYSLHGAKDLARGHLSRQVPSLFTSKIRRGHPLTCTAASRHLVSSATATSMTLSAADLHVQQAWDFWRKLGSPKYHVAPMVDQVPSSTRCFQKYINCTLSCSLCSPVLQPSTCLLQSELAFRQLCLRYGATAAYTPMLHSRLFLEDPKYRAEHFTTCDGDR